MPITADIYDLVQKFRQTLLEQLQQAAAQDSHHYQVVNIEHMQFTFLYVTKNLVEYSFILSIHPEALIENKTMQFFVGQAMKRIKLDLMKFESHSTRWVAKKSSECDDFAVVVRGGFTPNNPTVDEVIKPMLDILSEEILVGYDELEDMTGFAVYGSTDLPENTLIGTEPYHLVDFNDDERVARYAKGLKVYTDEQK